MTANQTIILIVPAAVVGALIWDRLRSNAVALTGAAILPMTDVASR